MLNRGGDDAEGDAEQKVGEGEGEAVVPQTPAGHQTSMHKPQTVFRPVISLCDPFQTRVHQNKHLLL